MKEKVKKFVLGLIPYVAIVVVIVLLRLYVVTLVRVDGNSMYPTFNNGDILLENKFDKSYERFNVIVFRHNNSKLVKRIIGLPGDSVEIKDNKLYINGEQINEGYEHLNTEDYSLKDKGIEKIPEGKYFVLGDNRTNSLDSRFFGLISEDDIDGVIGYSIYPFKNYK